MIALPQISNYCLLTRFSSALKILASKFVAETRTLHHQPAFEELVGLIGFDIVEAMAAAAASETLLAQPPRYRIVSQTIKCGDCESNTFEKDVVTGTLKCMGCDTMYFSKWAFRA